MESSCKDGNVVLSLFFGDEFIELMVKFREFAAKVMKVKLNTPALQFDELNHEIFASDTNMFP